MEAENVNPKKRGKRKTKCNINPKEKKKEGGGGANYDPSCAHPKGSTKKKKKRGGGQRERSGACI